MKKRRVIIPAVFLLATQFSICAAEMSNKDVVDLVQAEVAAAVQNQSGEKQENSQDQNGQKNKMSFVKDTKLEKIYNSGQLQRNVSKYQVGMGTIIPSVLITGVNSDLPGMIIGQVSQNVYDSQTGKYLLIPQGTKLIGQYDSQTTYAQTRALVVWQQTYLP